MAKVFIGQPCYGQIEMESADAIEAALAKDSAHDVTAVRLSSSLLANCFNQLFLTCLNADAFDYFVLLHADVAPLVPPPANGGWLDVLIAELEAWRLDVLHACCALKTMNGGTSTAAAYSDDRWGPRRRLTVRELERLWPTFTAATLREQLDPAIRHLLPNTGCMLLRVAPWMEQFPGFEIQDRIVDVRPGDRSDGVLRRDWQNVSEDWGFGYWAAANGLRVGGTTKVRTDHWGRFPFTTRTLSWGQPRDEAFFEERERGTGDGGQGNQAA